MQVAIHNEHVIMDRPAAQWLSDMGVPPGAIDIGGQAVYAVPHTFDAVKIFRNAGVELPTKLKSSGYAFPGKFKPYAHQLDTADFLAGYHRAFCLSSPGTGKTASAIWAADYLMKAGLIRRVLVLCPLSCVQSVWADEIFGITPHWPYALLHGPAVTRDALIDSEAKWLVANHDGVKSMCDKLASPESEIDLVIVDEMTAFKNESTARTKALKKVTGTRRVWAMTGTPIPQNPVDAYFMCKLLNPDAPKSKYIFQEQTMRKVTRFKWVAREDATARINAFMKPAIRYDKDDCLDMPAVTHSDRHVPLTPAQKQLIDELKKDWVSNYNGEKITAVNAAIEASKIFQVCQGSVITADGETLRVDATPRMDACLDIINESASKSVVFVSYKGGVAALSEYLESKNVTVGVITGDTSLAKRNDVISNFQRYPDPQVIVAHPRTASHGITLTAASTTIWFGPHYSGELYTQANNRTDRPGQKHLMRIVHLSATTEERAVYKALRDKEDTQGVLLDMYRRVVA